MVGLRDAGVMRVAVIGAGYMANKVHYPTLASLDGVEIAAICDRNASKREDTAGRFGVEKTYADYQQMIEDVAPDAVFAIGQPHTMYDVWVWCLQRGHHLFVEKPLGLTVHQARALAYLAETNGCITQVGFQRRASPLLNALLGHCRARGPVTYSSVEFTKNLPGPFVGPRDHMYDDGIHAIDTIRHMCTGDLVGVQSVTKRLGTPDINFMAALLEFDSGSVGFLACHWASGSRAFRIGVHAPAIHAYADLEGVGYLYQDGDAVGQEFDARVVAGSAELFVYAGFQEKIREFLASVRSGVQPSSNFSDALKTQLIAEQILAIDLLRKS